MQLIALEVPVPGVEEERFAALGREEAAAVWALTQSGVIRTAWFRADRTEAVLLLECPSAPAAEAALADLPFVRAGLIGFEVIPLRPYPGFARLFTETAP